MDINLVLLRPLRIPLRPLGLILTLIPCLLQAQYNSDFLHYDRLGRSVMLNLNYEAGSNGVSGALGNRLIWGGFISDETKNETGKLLRGRNNFGVMLDYGVSGFFKGSKRFDYIAGIKNQEVLNTSFTDDFFNLMFRGNGYFKDDTANLSNSVVNALRFQEVKFGIMMHHVDTLGKIGVSVSFLKGEQLFFIRTGERSSLYTSPLADEIVFQSNFSMALSDTNNRGLMSFNGVGASADIFFETPYKGSLGKRSVLTVNANNIGFIHWYDQSVQYSSDSTLSFTGFSVGNIAQLRDSSLSKINRDTLLRELANARRGSFNVNIPTNLLIVNKIYFGAAERTAFAFGFRHVFNANYKGYIFIEPEHRFGMVTAGVHIGYGGYTRLNVGASFTVDKGPLYLRLGSHALQGFFFPRSVFSQGVYFSLGWRVR